MNKKVLLFSLSLGAVYLAMSSYKTGPAASGLNRTGAAGSSSTCGGSGCHTGSTSTLPCNVTLLDTAGGSTSSVSSYVPNRTYKIAITGAVGASAMPKFGFQMAVTKLDNTNAGSLVNFQPSTAVRTLGSLKILEHSSPLASSASSYTAQGYWTAPPKGTGTVLIYGTINAVNDNGNATGDLPFTGAMKSISEDVTTGIGEVSKDIVRIYPNPCADMLHIENPNKATGSIQILDIQGRTIRSSASSANSISTAELQPGMYYVRIQTAEQVQLISFIKQ